MGGGYYYHQSALLANELAWMRRFLERFMGVSSVRLSLMFDIHYAGASFFFFLLCSLGSWNQGRGVNGFTYRSIQTECLLGIQ